MGDPLPEPHETVDSTEPWVHYFFSYTHIPVIKFDLEIRHSKKLTIKDNNYTNIL